MCHNDIIITDIVKVRIQWFVGDAIVSFLLVKTKLFFY
jgi:hypothetical protein